MPPAHGPADTAVAPPAAPPGDARAALPSAAAPVGYLDAPPGSFDPLFVGLAAAERAHDDRRRGPADPASRVLWLFFGDSHTAGDALTSRLRVTLQSKFGDAGRGLVAAGRPPTRHYYQRDVRYGTTGKWKAAVGGHKGDPEPYGLAGGQDHWYLMAWCRMRGGGRSFRLDRMQGARVTDERAPERELHEVAGEIASFAREASLDE
jgi:hypothetical protein